MTLHEEDETALTGEVDVVIGVDIGGTNTTVGVVDPEGHELLQARFQTQGHTSADEFVEHLAGVIRSLHQKLSGDHVVRGIGIAAPAANGRKGTLERPANLQWGDVPLADLVRKHFDLPVVLANDANAALLGELQYGVARGMENVVLITLGTGLGAGIMIDGKLVEGERCAAGEFGHITLDQEGRICGCGRRGCVETYVSASGLRRTVSELLATRLDESVLRDITFHSLTAETICRLALEGDPIAQKAFDVTGVYLGRLLANLAAIFDPEAVVLCGGLVNAGDLLVEPTRRSFDDHAHDLYRGNVRILVSALNNGQAAVLGACTLVHRPVVQGEV